MQVTVRSRLRMVRLTVRSRLRMVRLTVRSRLHMVGLFIGSYEYTGHGVIVCACLSD